MVRIALAIALGLSGVFISACANAAPSSERRLLFQTSAESDGPVVRIYTDDSVEVLVGDEKLVFTNAVVTYPRWNGTRYRARSNGRRLSLEIRSDRPCDVRGVDSERTAGVAIGLDGADIELTGCGFFTAWREVGE